jgi:hypothetical protein
VRRAALCACDAEKRATGHGSRDFQAFQPDQEPFSFWIAASGTCRSPVNLTAVQRPTAGKPLSNIISQLNLTVACACVRRSESARRFQLREGKAMNMAARRASRKAAWRLIPFLTLCYVIAFLDRVNVGFAALTMNLRLHRRDVRVQRRHLFLRLLSIRGAVQLDFGESRRAAMDCQDYDFLGRDFCVIRFRAFDFRDISKSGSLVLR